MVTHPFRIILILNILKAFVYYASRKVADSLVLSMRKAIG